MHAQIRSIIASILLTILPPVGFCQVVHSDDFEGFLPKNITEVTSFLQKYPNFDGRGIKIAILDSGVDPGAPGLSTTTRGLPKVTHILDATGSGDVDTSTIGEPDASGNIKGLSGRTLLLHPDWSNAKTTFHLGVVNGFKLFPEYVIDTYKKHAKKQMLETNEGYIQNAEETLKALDQNEPHDKTKKQDFKDRVALLKQLETSFAPPSPVYDCVVFRLEDVWRAVIDTDEDGDLRDETLLEDYSIHQRYANFGSETLVNFGVHMYDDGNLLSIIIPSSAHGTHVAGIIGAHYPNTSGRNGIAPGVQIVSIKIGDTRLDGMETGIALQRALRMVKELDCDLINMSYGEPTSTPNRGWFIDQVNELVREHNVTFVASAGNAGPALSTVGAPGGTSSSILAVGAYVHTSMMPLQYGMAHTPQNNLYTWSSRGPTTDGDLGVNFCAPGGAIAPVPTSSLVPAMQMNGTSMASPYACGAIALILSGLQSEDVSYFPYDVRMALEKTAQKQNHLDAFSQGHGLIQVTQAFEWLQSQEQTVSTLGFEIRNLSQSSGRGILLREAFATKTPSSHSIRIEPLFPESTEAGSKASFEILASLNSTADWVQFPDSMLIHHNGGKVSVIVDPTKLKPGSHSTFISGSDSFTGQAIFRIPINVIIPHPSVRNAENQWSQSVILQPGDITRLFIRPPSWAKWAEFNLRTNHPNSADRLALHTIQLLDSQRYNAIEWKKYISADALNHYESHIPVHGNLLMEWAFASYWSNRESMDLHVEINFRGLNGIQDTYHLPTHGTPILANIQGVHQKIHLQPKGAFTQTEFSLSPFKANVQPSTDPRDILVNDQRLHHLQLNYEWNNVGAASVTVRWNALAEALYDSPYSSFLWKLEDSHGRVFAYDDAWSEAISLKEGVHRITLNLWHEEESLLKKMKKLPITLRLPLDRPIPIALGSSMTAAAKMQAGRYKHATINENENQSIWISTQGSSNEENKHSGVQSRMIGHIQWLKSSAHNGAVLQSEVVLSSTSISSQDSEQVETTNEINFNHDLKSNWWDLRLKRLAHLALDPSDSEAFDTLYHSMHEEIPSSPEIQQILLKRLDGDDRKKNLDSILPLLEQMIQRLNETEIREYFAVRHTPKTKNEREKMAQMTSDKEQLLDLIYRKARALAYQETLTQEKTEAFDNALLKLRSWIDTNHSTYRLLDIREFRRQEAYGSALTLLNESIKENPNDAKLLKKKIKILNTLDWPFWVQYAHVQSYHRLPNLYPSVQIPADQ